MADRQRKKLAPLWTRIGGGLILFKNWVDAPFYRVGTRWGILSPPLHASSTNLQNSYRKNNLLTKLTVTTHVVSTNPRLWWYAATEDVPNPSIVNPQITMHKAAEVVTNRAKRPLFRPDKAHNLSEMDPGFDMDFCFIDMLVSIV